MERSQKYNGLQSFCSIVCLRLDAFFAIGGLYDAVAYKFSGTRLRTKKTLHKNAIGIEVTTLRTRFIHIRRLLGFEFTPKNCREVSEKNRWNRVVTYV